MAADLRQQINQIPAKNFLAVSLLLTCGYYFLLFEGAAKYKNQMSQLRNQIQALNVDIEANKKVIEDAERFRSEVNQISDQFQAAIEYLPSKTKIQDILTLLYNEARRTNVKLTRLRPMKPAQDKFYEELQMDIEVGGTYGEITNFLAKVSKIPRIINIRGVKLSPRMTNEKSDSLKLTLQGVLVTYRYLEGK